MRVLICGLVSLVTLSACTRKMPMDHYVEGQKILRSISNIETNILSTSGTDSGTVQPLLARMEALNIPGLSIAVFDQGHIIWAKGYGYADKALLTKVDTATLFQAASISKPLTSVATFALVEQGLIKLDVDVNDQLQSWKVPENEYTSEEKVTPRRIVSHLSGLSTHGFYGYNRKDTIPSIHQILDGLPPANSQPVRVIARPGTKEIYSGGGFTVLQLLLQEVSGQSFSSLMEELVIGPAGMTDSWFALEPPVSISAHLAKAHFADGKMAEDGFNLYPEQAAAGLWTTPCDLARFMLNVGDSYRGKKGILAQSTVQEMFKKIPGAGGLGFGIDGADEQLRFRHNGGNLGYTCYAVSFANIGRGIVVMTNSDNGSRLIREICRSVSKEYHWGSLLHGE